MGHKQQVYRFAVHYLRYVSQLVLVAYTDADFTEIGLDNVWVRISFCEIRLERRRGLFPDSPGFLSVGGNNLKSLRAVPSPGHSPFLG